VYVLLTTMVPKFLPQLSWSREIFSIIGVVDAARQSQAALR
jgi:hypothetical protein